MNPADQETILSQVFEEFLNKPTPDCQFSVKSGPQTKFFPASYRGAEGAALAQWEGRTLFGASEVHIPSNCPTELKNFLLGMIANWNRNDSL